MLNRLEDTIYKHLTVTCKTQHIRLTVKRNSARRVRTQRATLMHRAPLPAQILGVPGVHLHGDEYRGGPCPEELASQEKCAGSKDRRKQEGRNSQSALTWGLSERFPSCIVLSPGNIGLWKVLGTLRRMYWGVSASVSSLESSAWRSCRRL